MIGVNCFDYSFDEASIATIALVKAAPTPRFGGAVASEMSSSTMNKTRGVTVWAEETRPIVFVGVVTD
jgi:hypothetical protein